MQMYGVYMTQAKQPHCERPVALFQWGTDAQDWVKKNYRDAGGIEIRPMDVPMPWEQGPVISDECVDDSAQEQ